MIRREARMNQLALRVAVYIAVEKFLRRRKYPSYKIWSIKCALQRLLIEGLWGDIFLSSPPETKLSWYISVVARDELSLGNVVQMINGMYGLYSPWSLQINNAIESEYRRLMEI